MPECQNNPQRVNFIGVKSALSWDEYFMLQAMIASYKSKDPHTKVGCVFVDKNNHQITMGYNGMIAGIDESEIPWGNDKNTPLEFQKYGYVSHGEANAITHCAVNMEGSRAYVTLFPCNECAKIIATKKISEIVYLSDKYADSDETKISKRIFDLAGVSYRQLKISTKLIEKLNGYLLSISADT